MPMRAVVNHDVWCDANSSSIHWRFEELIARALSRGDRIALTVGSLGTLRNAIA